LAASDKDSLLGKQDIFHHSGIVNCSACCTPRAVQPEVPAAAGAHGTSCGDPYSGVESQSHHSSPGEQGED